MALKYSNIKVQTAEGGGGEGGYTESDMEQNVSVDQQVP